MSKKPMPRKSADNLRAVIVEAMARALFVMAWAQREDERGRSHSGEELMDVAPRTSPAAKKKATVLAREIQMLNGWPLESLYLMAALAPGKHYKKPKPADFGHGVAMQALGTGVSWFDDHPQFPIKVPHIEFYL